MDKDYLILKRASASRSSGEWNDDDYDVLANGEVVGRIFDASEPGLITHMCDTLGQSGAPILLLSQGSAKVIGIHSSRMQELEPNVGWKTIKSVGVSATEFGQSAVLTTP